MINIYFQKWYKVTVADYGETKESGNEIKGPSALPDKFGFVFETDLKQKYMVTISALKKLSAKEAIYS